MRTLAALSLVVAVGCSGNNQPAPVPDLSMSQPIDMAMMMNTGDMAHSNMCQPDPMTDSQPCGNGCPANSGTIPVQDQSGMCHCYYTCTPNQPNSCPCGRRCQGLCTPVDGGCVDNGQGACLHANGAGERCGSDMNGKPFGYGLCQDGTLCVNEGMTKDAYCMYKCTKQSDCPSGTTCLGLNTNPPSNACILNSSEMGTAIGMSCMPADLCAIASLCAGGTCTQQCNGPMDTTTCGNKMCKAIVDQNNMKIAGYVCQ